MPMVPEKQAVNIVIRGSFNPAIFNPSWFALNQLLSSGEVETADVKIIHADIALFTIDWLQLRVVPDRFQAITTQESHYERLRDLALGVFDLLTHTPVIALGINREFHVRFQSVSVWNEVGHRLVQKEDWRSLLEDPRTASLVVHGKRPDGLNGYIGVRIEPSPLGSPALYIEVNDHYQFQSDPKVPLGTSEAVQVLRERWNESMQRSFSIAAGLASLGE